MVEEFEESNQSRVARDKTEKKREEEEDLIFPYDDDFCQSEEDKSEPLTTSQRVRFRDESLGENTFVDGSPPSARTILGSEQERLLEKAVFDELLHSALLSRKNRSALAEVVAKDLPMESVGVRSASAPPTTTMKRIIGFNCKSSS